MAQKFEIEGRTSIELLPENKNCDVSAEVEIAFCANVTFDSYLDELGQYCTDSDVDILQVAMRTTTNTYNKEAKSFFEFTSNWQVIPYSALDRSTIGLITEKAIEMAEEDKFEAFPTIVKAIITEYAPETSVAA